MTRGTATIWLRDGRCYVGMAEVQGPWLSFTGWRWVAGCARGGPADSYTWPHRTVKSVYWHDCAEATA